MARSSVILTEVVDRVGWITLNRPERRNALDGELIEALDDAVAAMAEDADVRVVVLTGAPAEGQEGGFCSGGDVKRDRSDPRDAERMALGVPTDALAGDVARHEQHAAMRLHLMPKVTIAMVGGPAIGAGCSLAAACDLRFASPEAVFAAGFLRNGLAGDYGGTVWWTRIAGTAVTRRMYLLDEKIPADEALALGMVHRVVPAPELRSHTAEAAARLASVPTALMALVKDNLNQAEDEPGRRQWLFANEAENQAGSGRLIAERLARKRAGGG